MKVTLPQEWRSSDRELFQCPARWYLTRAFSESLIHPVWFPKGTAIHQAIEEVCLGELEPENMEARAISIFDELTNGGEDIEQWSKTDDRFSAAENSIGQCVNNWLKSVHPDSKERHFNYQAYQWPPQVELTAIKYGASTKIDATFIEKKNRWAAVVDWKTGGSSRADAEQLWMYQRTHPLDLPIQELWFHHLYEDKIQDVTYPGDDVVDTLIGYIKAVRRGGHYPTVKGWYCQYCPAQNICPVQNEKELGELPLSPTEIRWVSVHGKEGKQRWS